MKKWQNYLIQGLALAGQVGNFALANQWGSGNTPELIAAGIAAIQMYVGILAHNYNPDGTPAAAPYRPAAKQ